MDSDKIVAMASLLILGGVIPLAVALTGQYAFGLHPCHFCLLQRYPYVLTILLGILSLLVVRGGIVWRVIVALGIYAWLVTGVLGLIHTALEAGVLGANTGCVSQPPQDNSLDAMRSALLNAPLVSCAEVSASFGSVSMATWNAVFAFSLILLTFFQYRFDVKRYVAKLN